MNLIVETIVKGANVTHRYLADGRTWEWHLSYPVEIRDSLAVHLPGLAYAYHFLSGKRGPHTVESGKPIPGDMADELVAMWADRCQSEDRFKQRRTFAGIQFHGKRYDAPPYPVAAGEHGFNSPAVMFSYGKESVLTRRLLLDVGIKPRLFSFFWPGRQPPVTMQDHYGVASDFERIIKHRGYWVSEFTQLIFAPMIEDMMVDTLLLGTEYEDGLIEPLWGYLNPTSFQQSQRYEGIAGRLISLAVGRQVDCCSIVRPFTEMAVLKTMVTRYPNDFKRLVRSCWRCRKPGDEAWCGRCPKCVRIHSLFCSLQIVPPFSIRLPVDKDVSKCIADDDDPVDVEYRRLSMSLGASISDGEIARIPLPSIRNLLKNMKG